MMEGACDIPQFPRPERMVVDPMWRRASNDDPENFAQARRNIAKDVRLVFALILIALEFTNLFQFCTFLAISNPHLKRLALGLSPYTLQLLSYGVCLIVFAGDRHAVKKLLEKPVLGWVFVAACLFTWAMLLRAINGSARFEDYLFERPFLLRINALAFLVSCVLIFDGREVLVIVKRAVVGATLFAVALNLYEVVYPGTFDYLIPGRSAGVYVNPNGSGIAIVFGVAIGLTALPRRWREWFLFAAALGVGATFSREAMAAFALVALGATMGRAVSWPRLVVMAAIVTVVFSIANLGAELATNGVLNADNVARFKSITDASAESRYHLARMLLEKFEEAPLLGNGFDTAGYWNGMQSHNLYLSFMADHGIFGVLLIPALMASVFRRSWDSYAFAGAFMLWCMFDHGLFMDSFALIALAIQADLSAAVRAYRRRARELHWIQQFA